jgi:hypothetical protein
MGFAAHTTASSLKLLKYTRMWSVRIVSYEVWWGCGATNLHASVYKCGVTADAVKQNNERHSYSITVGLRASFNHRLISITLLQSGRLSGLVIARSTA